MNSDKKMYLFSGLAIALAVVAYVVITRKKKSDTDPISNEQPDVTTPTGDVITNQQAVIYKSLEKIINQPLAQVKAQMLGKSIYSKVDNINPRQTPYVNNGWFINNTVNGRITQKGTFAGTVTDVAKDSGSMSNAQGRVYIWFKVKPSAEAVKQIKDDRNIFLGTKTDTFWLREDVVVKK